VYRVSAVNYFGTSSKALLVNRWTLFELLQRYGVKSFSVTVSLFLGCKLLFRYRHVTVVCIAHFAVERFNLGDGSNWHMHLQFLHPQVRFPVSFSVSGFRFRITEYRPKILNFTRSFIWVWNLVSYPRGRMSVFEKNCWGEYFDSTEREKREVGWIVLISTYYESDQWKT
jgi:hypothetical protein